MSEFDDLPDVTHPLIPDEFAERLLTGDQSALDDRGDVGELLDLMRAARSPAEPAELAGLERTVARFGAVVVTTQSLPPAARTTPMFKKFLTAKSLATIGVVTFLSAGAAAAAGVVPSPFTAAERPTLVAPEDASPADGLEDAETTTTAMAESTTTESIETTTTALVESTTTESIETTTTASTEPTESTVGDDGSGGNGPDATGPAKFGLCTAYAAHTKHDDEAVPDGTSVATADDATDDSDEDAGDDDGDDGSDSVPFQNLADAASAAGQSVEDFCADATPGRSADAPGQSDHNPSATAPGHAGDNPSATAPGHADDEPSSEDAEEDGDDDAVNPSATAPGKSDDKPSHGNGNGNGKSKD